jgi:hypothetical protein
VLTRFRVENGKRVLLEVCDPDWRPMRDTEELDPAVRMPQVVNDWVR